MSRPAHPVLLCCLLILGTLSEGDAATCASCVTTYEAARDAGGATNTDKCTALKTYMTCLETGTSCPITAAQATAIGTDFTAIQGDCTLDAACTCQKNYWGTDHTTSTCAAAKVRFGCLNGAAGSACDGTTTVSALGSATTGFLPASGCTLTAACTCEQTYVSADISDNAKKCTAQKAFASCLKEKTDTMCDGTTTVVQEATALETSIGAITDCTIEPVCACEIAYAKADIGDDNKKCSARKDYLACLAGKSGAGCVAGTTAKTLTTASKDVSGITDCAALTDVCNCEVAYGETDISGDTNMCNARKAYLSCLKGKTGAGCISTGSTAKTLTTASKDVTGITGCTLTDTCSCEVAYGEADISSDLCTETKKYVACLKGKTNPGCVSTVVNLATAAETTINGISTCSQTGKLCACDIAYAKSDISNNAMKCKANKDYISCALGKTGTGCDGTKTLSTLVTEAESAITTIGSTCTKTAVCDCEIVYGKANIASDSNKCTALKALTTCMLISTEAGCGASTTKANVGAVANTAFTAITATCTRTPTCTCQSTFNAASLTAADKCTSGTALVTCLNAISSTTETACDGTQLTAALKTNVTTSVQAVLCSSCAEFKSSVLVSLGMLVSALALLSN